MTDSKSYNRRKILQYMSPMVAVTAGCSSIGGSSDDGVQDSDGDGVIDSEDYAPQDPDVQERSDVESSTESENQESEQTDSEQDESASNEEQLVEFDSAADLLPAPVWVKPDYEGDYQISSIDQNPDTELRVDVTAFYSGGGVGTPQANVAITAYDNIPDAEQRYDDSNARADLEYDVSRVAVTDIVDEQYRYNNAQQDEAFIASRFRNVFFQVRSPLEESANASEEAHDAIASKLEDNLSG